MLIRNVIIIVVSAGIVFWCLYVFIKQRNFSSFTKKTTFGLGLLWLLTTFFPNIPIVSSPLTPQIKGKIIDTETKQPVASCNIKAYWEVETHSLVGATTKSYHMFHTNTDANGHFEIPKYQKILGLYGFFPLVLSNQFSGMHIVAYDYSHKYKLISVDKENLVWTSTTVNDQNIQFVANGIVIRIETLASPSAFIENITDLELNVLSSLQRSKVDSDVKFLVNGVDYLGKYLIKLDCSIYKNGMLPRYSKLVEELGDIDQSIKVREIGMVACRKEAEYENLEISRLKQLKKKGGR